VLVPIEDVVYLKAELKYITIRTVEREYLLEESLTRLEEEFGPRFVRVHRNCLVARDFIRGFERRVGDEGDAHWEVLLRTCRNRCRSRAASSRWCGRSGAWLEPGVVWLGTPGFALLNPGYEIAGHRVAGTGGAGRHLR